MRRQLGQRRPTTTSAEVLFSPSTNKPYTMDSVVITNVSGVGINVSIYHDVDGTTYDESTAVLWQKPLPSKGTYTFSPKGGLSDYQKNGNIAVQVDVANGATFTGYGEIEGEII